MFLADLDEFRAIGLREHPADLYLSSHFDIVAFSYPPTPFFGNPEYEI
jgi:hypothetical protein